MGIIFKDQDGNILDSNGNPVVNEKSYHWDGGNIPEVKVVTTTEDIDLDIPLPKLKPGNQKLYERDNEPIPMSEEMTTRLWEVINENTELKQQLYMVENKLEQIKRLL